MKKLLYLSILAAVVLPSFVLPSFYAAEFAPRTAEETASLLDAVITAEPTLPIIGAEQKTHRAVLLKPNTDWGNPDSIIWSWDAAKSPDILPEQAKWFSHISEVKPVDGTSRLLVAASGGGVALVRTADQKVLFYAYAGGNTHSAAVLPDGNIVSASSTGNFMKIFIVPENFTAAADVQSTEIPFTDTHGVIWDKKRELLWVLGGKSIAGFRYTGTKTEPALEEVFQEELPPILKGGHDLYPVPASDLLFVTGEKGIGLFDPNQRKLSVLRDIANIKSLSLDENGNLLVIIPVEKWWTPTPLYLNRAEKKAGTLPEARFYKVRWWTGSDF